MKTDEKDHRVKALFAKRLGEYMDRYNISIAEVAEAMDRDPGSVRRWLEGQTAPKSIAELARLAEVLGVPVDMLLAESPDRFESGRRSMIARMRRQLDKWDAPEPRELEVDPEPDMDGDEADDATG